MKILGIFNGMDAGATLSIDGKIVGAIQEERITREKFISGYPHQSIDYLLKQNNLDHVDIDIVASGAFSFPTEESINHYFTSIKNNEYDTSVASERMYYSLKQDFKFRDIFYRETYRLFPNVNIEFYDHHYSHACTAFYTSDFQESYIITADGRGDLQSIVVWKADRKMGLIREKTFSELFSLGLLYSQVTAYLGFKAHRHEGKITGLASFGKDTDLVGKLEQFCLFENGEFINKYDKEYKPYLSTESIWLEKITQNYSKQDIAFAIQKVLERTILKIISYYIPQDKSSNLCLAGGVFANVKLNQQIREKMNLQDYFIFPAMGDGGICYGACIASNIRNNINNDFTIKNIYTGTRQLNWEKFLCNKKFVFKSFIEKELVQNVVELLVNKKIIGVITEAMEFGPRALGANSILIDASDPSININVNKRLNRTEFMPFAPVTLASEASKMYINLNSQDKNTYFMTTCYSCTDEMKKLSPATVHIDNTARPQIINENNSTKLYYSILKEYFLKTQIPTLVNTSFNNHEEPIVFTPQDALDSLEKGNIDYIVTSNYIISLT